MLCKKHFLLVVVMAVAVISTLATVALAKGNSFIVGDLRVDLPEVYNAKDYRVHLSANSIP